jgi:hypothetical protein
MPGTRQSLRAINHNSSSCCVLGGTILNTYHHVVVNEARPSVLSITTHHHVVHETSLRAINHNNTSSCAFTKGARPSVLSTSSSLCFHGKVPPCYQSQLIIMFSRKASLRAINHNSSSCCGAFKGARPSVLSITTHHRCVFTKGHVPPCYQSQLIIMLCFHEKGTSLRINHNSSSCCVFTKGTSSSNINHNSSSYVVFHKAGILQSIAQLIISCVLPCH